MSKQPKNNRPVGNMETAIIAIILATALCIFVNYITNPDITTTFSGLKVHFMGEEKLREKGLVITGREDIPPSSVVVSGKRKDLVESMERVALEVDVSDITEEGSYSLTGTISLPTTKVVIEKEKYSAIPIKVEKLSEKEIPIKIRQTGTNKDKFVKSVPEKDTVIITGSQSELEHVSCGVADVDISKIGADITMPVKYILLDDSGSYIEKNETLESYTAEIFVKNTVYNVKRLPVKLKLTDEMEKKYVLNEEKSSVSVSNIDVGVRQGNNDEYVTVNIDRPESSASEYEIEQTSGMYIPDGYKKVKVRPDLTEKVKKSIELTPSARNLSDGLTAKINNVNIEVTGTEDKLNADNIKAFVNLDGMSEGEKRVKLEIEGDGVSAENLPEITVIISKE